MNRADIFISIYNGEKEKIRDILLLQPDFIEKTLKENCSAEDIEHYNAHFIKNCISRHENILTPSYMEETPLLFAARLGEKEICDMLIDEFNANINAINVYGHNSAMSALSNARERNMITGLSLLNRNNLDLNCINYGKYDLLGNFTRNPDLKYMKTSDMKTNDSDLSTQSVQLVIDKLISLNFNPNSLQGKYNESAFSLACEKGNWLIALYLITKGADYSVEYEKIGIKHSMILNLCYVQYFPPNVKESLFKNIEMVCQSVNHQYGKIQRPEHWYLDFLTGKPIDFDYKRWEKYE